MNSQAFQGSRRIPLWYPPVVFLAGGVLSSAGYVYLARVFHASTTAHERPWWLQIAAILFLWITMLTGTWWAHREYGPIFERGFFRVRLFQAPRSDGVYLVLGVVLQLLVGVLYYPFHSQSAGQPVHDILGDAHGWRVAVVMASAGLGAPLVEELFFRGLLLRSLQTVPRIQQLSRFATLIPVVLSGLLFAAAHFQGVQFFGLALVGVVLAVIRTREGRLAPSVFAHAGFNLIALFVAYFLSSGL